MEKSYVSKESLVELLKIKDVNLYKAVVDSDDKDKFYIEYEFKGGNIKDIKKEGCKEKKKEDESSSSNLPFIIFVLIVFIIMICTQ